MKEDYGYFKRQEALNAIKAELSLDAFNNTRAGYWRTLKRIKKALITLEENQAYDPKESKEIRDMNEKARDEYNEN